MTRPIRGHTILTAPEALEDLQHDRVYGTVRVVNALIKQTALVQVIFA